MRSRSHERVTKVSETDVSEVTRGAGFGLKKPAERELISYRLGRFEVLENENGEVSWKTHAGLGRLKHGMCSIKDDILFMGASSKVELKKRGEIGFSKKPFFKDLSKLLGWEKTKYYCSSYTIRTCVTGGTPSPNEMSPRSNERMREDISQAVIDGIRSPSMSMAPRHNGPADFKEYVNRTKERLFSARAQLLSGCIAFCVKFFNRGHGGKSRRNKKSGR